MFLAVKANGNNHQWHTLAIEDEILLCNSSLPLVKSEVKPFHVKAERITAGQNGATNRDQSSDLMSYININHVKTAIQFTWPVSAQWPYAYIIILRKHLLAMCIGYLKWKWFKQFDIIRSWAPGWKIIRITNLLQQILLPWF